MASRVTSSENPLREPLLPPLPEERPLSPPPKAPLSPHSSLSAQNESPEPVSAWQESLAYHYENSSAHWGPFRGMIAFIKSIFEFLCPWNWNCDCNPPAAEEILTNEDDSDIDTLSVDSDDDSEQPEPATGRLTLAARTRRFLQLEKEAAPQPQPTPLPIPLTSPSVIPTPLPIPLASPSVIPTPLPAQLQPQRAVPATTPDTTESDLDEEDAFVEATEAPTTQSSAPVGEPQPSREQQQLAQLQAELDILALEYESYGSLPPSLEDNPLPTLPYPQIHKPVLAQHVERIVAQALLDLDLEKCRQELRGVFLRRSSMGHHPQMDRQLQLEAKNLAQQTIDQMLHDHEALFEYIQTLDMHVAGTLAPDFPAEARALRMQAARLLRCPFPADWDQAANLNTLKTFIAEKRSQAALHAQQISLLEAERAILRGSLAKKTETAAPVANKAAFLGYYVNHLGLSNVWGLTGAAQSYQAEVQKIETAANARLVQIDQELQTSHKAMVEANQQADRNEKVVALVEPQERVRFLVEKNYQGLLNRAAELEEEGPLALDYANYLINKVKLPYLRTGSAIRASIRATQAEM